MIVDKAWYTTPRVREYIATCWTPPVQREKVKINNKWRGSSKPHETKPANHTKPNQQPKEFKFCINQNQSKFSKDSQYGGSVFVFGGSDVKKSLL